MEAPLLCIVWEQDPWSYRANNEELLDLGFSDVWRPCGPPGGRRSGFCITGETVTSQDGTTDGLFGRPGRREPLFGHPRIARGQGRHAGTKVFLLHWGEWILGRRLSLTCQRLVGLVTHHAPFRSFKLTVK